MQGWETEIVLRFLSEYEELLCLCQTNSPSYTVYITETVGNSASCPHKGNKKKTQTRTHINPNPV